jgi:biopolymer transport protein ExbD
METDSELLLAAMVDMMVNVLLFLLTLYGTSPGSEAGELELPGARSEAPLVATVHLTVTPQVVAVDGKTALALRASPEGPRLPERVELDTLLNLLATRRGAGESPPPLAVEVDRRVPWTTLEPLLDVAGQAGFSDLRFVTTSLSVVGAPG